MKPGRNDLCACGSGKTYKHCCLHAGAGAASATDPAEFAWRRMRAQLEGYVERMIRFIHQANGPAAVLVFDLKVPPQAGLPARASAGPGAATRCTRAGTPPRSARSLESMVIYAERSGQTMDVLTDPAVFVRLRERLGLAKN
jgi:hypothetical protein